MVDTFGGIEIPVQVPGGDAADPTDAPGDPLLDVSLDFFKSLLNRYLGSAWGKITPGTPPVKTVKANDPDTDFKTQDLPTLYLWRSGGEKSEWYAEDILLQRDNLTLYWVFPIARMEFRAFRSTIMAASEKIIAQAVHRNRDPAWVFPDDPDPNSQARGSVFSKQAGWFEFHIGKWTQTAYARDVADAKPEFMALQMQIAIAEEYREDNTVRTDPLTRGDITVETSDQGFSVFEHLT